MAFGNFWEGFDPLRILLSLITLTLFFLFLPRIMLFMVLNKIRSSTIKLNRFSTESENIFLTAISRRPSKKLRSALEPMKNLVIVSPTGIDPYGLVKKFEHVLDNSESKIKNFISQIAPNKSEEEKANLAMAFKGVYGAHQLFVIMRHFQKLIEKTNNFQLGSAIQMFLPMYEELAEAQRDATEAFVNEVPIGDSVGPFVATNFIKKNPEEIAEDVLLSKVKFKNKNLFILKSKGPGSRLGKYGDAVKKVVEKNNIGEIICVDAGLRFEGEETGTIVEGVGVLMGGPGVEKYKIEEIASEKNINLTGLIIKMSASQASKAMGKKIYNAGKEAVKKIEKYIERSRAKNILLLGVGNTAGIGNKKEDLSKLPKKLSKYWKKEEKDTTSYFGLIKAFPFGGG